MSIIIADSGSTKTQWNILNSNGDIEELFSIGINPYFINKEDIEKTILRLIDVSKRESVRRLYFYGSGCSAKDQCDLVSSALQTVFPLAKIEVHSDLLAAGRALFGDSKGVACILGTGSNVAVYENNIFTENINSLGYIIGDQASGAYIGKELVRAYFQKDMPADIRSKFEEYSNIKLSEVLDKVYKRKFPNRYLAGFTPFASQYIDNEFINSLISDAIDKFINLQLGSLSFDKSYYKVGFVGSVAYYFKDILIKALNNNDYQVGKIIKAPMEGLLDYHAD